MLYAHQNLDAGGTERRRSTVARGFGEAEIAQIFEKLAGKKPSRSLVTSLQLATDGDPVFLVEIIRRMLIDQELREFDGAADCGFEMPEGCRDLLAVASVIGKTFDGGRASEQPGSRDSQEPSGAVFREESEYSTIVFDGKTATVRNSKGLRYLAQLLRHPREAIHVSELARAGHTPTSGESAGHSHEQETVSGLGHAGEVLDARARAEYRRRLEDLQVDLEEATRRSDFGRARRAREEIDFLTHELASACGIGGRSRKGADSSERIRKAVTNRLRHVIARLERAHPTLGSHLLRSIRMGTFCSYAPDEPIEWGF